MVIHFALRAFAGFAVRLPINGSSLGDNPTFRVLKTLAGCCSPRAGLLVLLIPDMERVEDVWSGSA